MITGQIGDSKFNMLFGNDVFQYNGNPIPVSKVELKEEPKKDWGDDFYMEHAMTLGEGFDRTYRDNYGNYDKDTYWYQKMKENGFPYGDDEMPELLENDEFYD